jgi:hypothetical protein
MKRVMSTKLPVTNPAGQKSAGWHLLENFVNIIPVKFNVTSDFTMCVTIGSIFNLCSRKSWIAHLRMEVGEKLSRLVIN